MNLGLVDVGWGREVMKILFLQFDVVENFYLVVVELFCRKEASSSVLEEITEN